MRNIIVVFCLILLSPVFAHSEGKYVDYSVDGNVYEGYYVEHKKGGPLVLIVHDWDGLTDYEVKRATMLKDLGYSVFVADLFGKNIRPKEISEKKRLTSSLYKDRKKMRSLLMGALLKAESFGAQREHCIAIGYCFGGTAILEMARSGVMLKGFVSFHGGLTIPEGQDYSTVNGDILVFHGTADKVVKMSQFAGLAEELERQNVQHEMITYSGAPHAFTVFGSTRYREAADKKSWFRFTEYLGEKILSKEATVWPP